MRILALWQRDKRWRDFEFGRNDEGKLLTVGNWGCLLVVYAMWLQYMKVATLPPLELRALLRGTGGMSQLYLGEGALKRAFPGVVDYQGWMNRDNPAMLDVLFGLLRRGIPVPLRVDFVPATSKHEQHWVLAGGWDGERIWIFDPHYGRGGWLDEMYGIPGIDVLEILRYELAEGAAA